MMVGLLDCQLQKIGRFLILSSKTKEFSNESKAQIQKNEVIKLPEEDKRNPNTHFFHNLKAEKSF